MKFWKQNDKVLKNADGKIINCQTCPCQQQCLDKDLVLFPFSLAMKYQKKQGYVDTGIGPSSWDNYLLWQYDSTDIWDSWTNSIYFDYYYAYKGEETTYYYTPRTLTFNIVNNKSVCVGDGEYAVPKTCLPFFNYSYMGTTVTYFSEGQMCSQYSQMNWENQQTGAYSRNDYFPSCYGGFSGIQYNSDGKIIKFSFDYKIDNTYYIDLFSEGEQKYYQQHAGYITATGTATYIDSADTELVSDLPQELI